MSLYPRHLVLAFVLTGTLGAAWAQQGPGIYTCVDAKGRRLTSDRPIVECLDREQKELNASGTVRRVLGPTLTASERAEQEQREHQAALQRQHEEEERRALRALATRYPNQASHDMERAKALQGAEDSIESARRRLDELKQERQKLQADAEFYKDKRKMPPKLRRQFEDNDQQREAQDRYIADQEQEKRRINAQFDQELAKLRLLWAQAQPTTASAAASAPVVKR